MSLRFLRPAAVELRIATTFYEGEAVGLGERFMDEVESALDRVQTHSEIGAPAANFRKLVLKKFPFSLIYALEQNEIVVVAVAHHRQRPGYWIGRDR